MQTYIDAISREVAKEADSFSVVPNEKEQLLMSKFIDYDTIHQQTIVFAVKLMAAEVIDVANMYVH